MHLVVRTATVIVGLGLAGSLAACGGSSTSAGSGAISSASAAVGSAASAASSAVSSAASSVAGSPGSSGSEGAGAGAIEIATITGGSTQVTFDQTFLSALQSLGLTPSAAGDAQLTGSTASFPVTGGSFRSSGGGSAAWSGTIDHRNSGLALTAGPVQTTLQDFQIDPSAQVVFGDVSVVGQTATQHVRLFGLDTSAAQVSGSGSEATVRDLRLSVSQDAAELLNRVLGSSGVQADLAVGTATVTVRG